jgi:hypothetical protein
MGFLNSLSWARRRQAITLTIVAIFLTVFFGSIGYFALYEEPTCFDGKKNGSEAGVDCGGKCALVCEEVRDPVVTFSRIFKSVRGYSAVAHIENQNDLISRNALYSFKLYDEGGNLLAEREGTAFLPKRKAIPIFEANIDTKGAVPHKVFFAFKNNIAWEVSDYEEPRLIVEDEKLSSEKIAPRLEASIYNPGVRTVSNIDVTAVLYDDAGNAVNSSKTVIKSIGPNERAPVTFTWPYPLPETVNVCVQPVDIAVVIDRSGSMAFDNANPPQPLTETKKAASYFVSQLNDKSKASVVSFGNDASIDLNLTTDLKKASLAVENIYIHTDSLQNTNIADGLEKALDELNSSRHNPISLRAVALLTDGLPTRPLKPGDKTYPANAAIEVANKIKASNILLFTIGLGNDLDKSFLTNLASNPTDAYFAPTTSELSTIYRSIGTKICKRGTSRIEISPRVPPSL